MAQEWPENWLENALENADASCPVLLNPLYQRGTLPANKPMFVKAGRLAREHIGIVDPRYPERAGKLIDDDVLPDP